MLTKIHFFAQVLFLFAKFTAKSHHRLFTWVQEEEEEWLLEAEMSSLSVSNCISLITAKSNWRTLSVSATTGY